MSDEIEVAILTGTFDARSDAVDALAATLARYVVLTRRKNRTLDFRFGRTIRTHRIQRDHARHD